MKNVIDPFVICAAVIFPIVVCLSDLRHDPIVLFIALANFVCQLVLLVDRDRQ